MDINKTKRFIEKAVKIHGQTYDYSEVDYVNNRTPVKIICKEHGVFLQTPDKHLNGRGCPTCGGTTRMDEKTFIEKARALHGNKYDYSEVVYVNNQTKVKIICPEHGVFEQTPHNHLKGQGCPVCGKTLTAHPKYNENEFILEAIKVHNGKYQYDRTKYKTLRDKIYVTCPIHGDFLQIPYLHLLGSGCPECAHSQNGINKRLSDNAFILKAKEKHGDVYDYSQVKYITAKDKVTIICKKHGPFLQTPDKHLSGCGCPKCIQPYSKDELEIADYVKSLVGNESVVMHDRDILGGKEVDIFVPTLNVAFEYNGLYWHTIEHTRTINYHLDKTIEASKKGIKLFQIFEDEYRNHKEIVLSKIRHLLQKDNNLPRVFGRQCIVEVSYDNDTVKKLLEENHIQGYAGSSIKLLAKYNNTPVAAMLFKKTNDSDEWELVRYASDIHKLCVGVGGKLFSYFVKNYHPKKVISFADMRWTVDVKNNIYTSLGFNLSYITKPDYRYYNPSDGQIRQHKFGFRKQKLNKKYGLPLSMTESQMTKQLGYSKIYDCGLIKFTWKA
jgi:hypothetical protein